jgi:L-threonylcarbamoyladenylate synthase
VALIGKDIVKAAELLKAGNLVAIPTETVYGLAANALDELAVAKVFEAKNRPHFDPLIIHTFSLEKAQEYVSEIPEALKKLAEKFWPGPLTLLLPKRNVIPDLVTAGLDSVAVRVPSHPLTLSLLQHLERPLAAPSANPFGYISPTSPEHVDKQLGDKLEYILDGGTCEVGLESTIVGMEEGKICVYRLGGLSLEEIEKVVGNVELKLNESSDPKAPGQLKSHYAPLKPLFIGDIEELIRKNSSKKIGIICFGKQNLQGYFTLNLSEKADLTEAAANLFSVLRKMDESDVDLILCSYLPETGLGPAINDRLKRASA